MSVKTKSDGRDQQAQSHPQKIELIDKQHARIVEQVRDASAKVFAIGLEAPPDVRMPQSAQHIQRPVSMQMRGMRITLLIRGLMMSAVRGAPSNRHSLSGGGATDSQKKTNRFWSFERAMRQQTVKTDRDAKARERVHHNHRQHFRPADSAVTPEQSNGGDQPDERADDREEHHDLLQARHAIVRVFGW